MSRHPGFHGRLCGGLCALLLAPVAFAAPRASQIQSNLGALEVQTATTTDSAGLARPTPPGLEVKCNLPLPEDPSIDQRLEWARSVEECLQTAQANLQTNAMLMDSNTRGLALQRQSATKATLLSIESYKATLSGEKDFIGLKWGVGIGFSHGFDDIVDEAVIVDGVVRVKKDLTDQPRVILEFHNYRWCHSKRKSDVPIVTGCGPFAAVATRDDKVVSGVAAGWMYGWKTGTGEDSQGFSVALGVILDSSGKELGEGFKDGEAAPVGATEVFLKEKSVASAVLFFTRTF